MCRRKIGPFEVMSNMLTITTYNIIFRFSCHGYTTVSRTLKTVKRASYKCMSPPLLCQTVRRTTVAVLWSPSKQAAIIYTWDCLQPVKSCCQISKLSSLYSHKVSVHVTASQCIELSITIKKKKTFLSDSLL